MIKVVAVIWFEEVVVFCRQIRFLSGWSFVGSVSFLDLKRFSSGRHPPVIHSSNHECECFLAVLHIKNPNSIVRRGIQETSMRVIEQQRQTRAKSERATLETKNQ
jgi:hypothetical protein